MVVNGLAAAHMEACITNPNYTSSVPRSSYVDFLKPHSDEYYMSASLGRGLMAR